MVEVSRGLWGRQGHQGWPNAGQQGSRGTRVQGGQNGRDGGVDRWGGGGELRPQS